MFRQFDRPDFLNYKHSSIQQIRFLILEGMKKKTILIVEDEKPLAKILDYKLGGEGFRILVAGDGREGLDIALKDKPDLIILDIIMPRMDGTTLLQKLRKDPWGKRAAVIILTNVYDPERMMEFSRKGSFEGGLKYYTKADYSIKRFTEEVKSFLK